jgi:hypothetical protein
VQMRTGRTDAGAATCHSIAAARPAWVAKTQACALGTAMPAGFVRRMASVDRLHVRRLRHMGARGA